MYKYVQRLQGEHLVMNPFLEFMDNTMFLPLINIRA